MCISNYIKKHYAILTYVLCVLFVIALGFSAYFTFQIKPKDISLGIIILLFADVAMGILPVISMVSMFYEVSRLHAREFPKDAIDQMAELSKICDKLREDFENNKELPDKIAELKSVCDELKNNIVTIESTVMKKDDVTCIINEIKACCDSLQKSIKGE